MAILRLSKILSVYAIALFASLVVFGNIADYDTNKAFVEHVFSMDTLFSGEHIRWRSITSPRIQTLGYLLIITAETLTAVLCWWGATRLLYALRRPASAFNKQKSVAIAGLTVGFLTWQVAFMSIGGEWFGMWMSQKWNGVPDAFRFFITILMVLIYLIQRDDECR